MILLSSHSWFKKPHLQQTGSVWPGCLTSEPSSLLLGLEFLQGFTQITVKPLNRSPCLSLITGIHLSLCCLSDLPKIPLWYSHSFFTLIKVPQVLSVAYQALHTLFPEWLSKPDLLSCGQHSRCPYGKPQSIFSLKVLCWQLKCSTKWGNTVVF